MSTQLEIEVPIDTNNDSYKTAMARYSQMSNPEKQNIFLCYFTTQKKYFISWYSSRQTIESYKTIKIIECQKTQTQTQ